MKRRIISLARGELAERHISQTQSYSPGAAHGSPERIVPMKKKRIVTLALAAATALFICDTRVQAGYSRMQQASGSIRAPAA